MTLTDLANHICTQCGMTDTDDVAAAQMFLQRRLEMIWNSALWRDSLLEATLTINPGGSGGSTTCMTGQGTTTLADSYWIPQRSVLLLPAAIEKVIAARLDTNTLEVASLESYYRTDTDWLNYQGSPFEFQILKPVVMEWATAQTVTIADSNQADNNLTANYACSPDGVSIVAGSVSLNATIGGSTTGQGSTTGVLQLFSFSKPPGQGNVALQISVPVSVGGINYSGSPQPAATVAVTQGQVYTITPGASESGVVLVNGTQTITLQTGTTVTVTAQGAQLVFQCPNLIPSNAEYTNSYVLPAANQTTYNIVFGANESELQCSGGNPTALFASGTFTTGTFGAQLLPIRVNNPVTAQLYLAGGAALTATIVNVSTFATVLASCNNAPVHQRIRLTEAPQVSINLRVLGKGKCPVLGPYDTAPITNVEPALMAFARGDLLLRQRQFGKAALAQQEGAALLKELVENEAFQQAGEFRIQPDGGFGSDNFWMQTVPDSYRPLG